MKIKDQTQFEKETLENFSKLDTKGFVYQYGERTTYAVKPPSIKEMMHMLDKLALGVVKSVRLDVVYGETITHPRAVHKKKIGKAVAVLSSQQITLYSDKTTIENGIVRIHFGGMCGTPDMMTKPNLVFSMFLNEPADVRAFVSKPSSDLMGKMYEQDGSYNY